MPAVRTLRGAFGVVAMILAGCGPSPSAMVADDEAPEPTHADGSEHRTTALDPGWEDAGFTYFADPDETLDVGLLDGPRFDLDAVQSGCLAMVDTSRVEVIHAIEVAHALHDFDRAQCLAREAQVLAALVPMIEDGAFGPEVGSGDPSFAVVSACRAARESRRAAEACTAPAR